jgi:SAM-dependent methyltransferase
MPMNSETHHLYSDLAWLWPLWGSVENEYADYCRAVTTLIGRYAQHRPTTLLNIGCGGGKNLFNLKRSFAVTGLDLSPIMLQQAAALNPECRLVQGDMRNFSLHEGFDAILMDDAISYMQSREELAAALKTAYAHLNRGGVMVVTPDTTPERFQQNQTTTTHVQRGDLDVVFIENLYDPDPSDTQYEATILYLIREHGALRIATDHWSLGIFSLAIWREVLTETGFTLHEEQYHSQDESYVSFACIKENG